MVKIAVVDTCALFSASLRDVLLLAAEVKIYDIRLTDEILEELRRNLINKRKISEKQAHNLIVTIQSYSDAGCVGQGEMLSAGLRPSPCAEYNNNINVFGQFCLVLLTRQSIKRCR